MKRACGVSKAFYFHPCIANRTSFIKNGRKISRLFFWLRCGTKVKVALVSLEPCLAPQAKSSIEEEKSRHDEK
jgi:hypothetical protein